MPIFVKLETFFATNKYGLALSLGGGRRVGGVLRSHIQGDKFPIFVKLETIFGTNKYGLALSLGEEGEFGESYDLIYRGTSCLFS